MATDLTYFDARIYLDVTAKSQKSLDLSIPEDNIALRPSLAYTFGGDEDVAGEADQVYHDQFTIAASGNVAINLSTCINPFSTASAFAYVKAVIIQNASALAGVSVGGGTWIAWFADASDKEIIKAGFTKMLAGPTHIAAVGSGETLTITNLDGVNAATINVVIIGVVA